MLLDQVTLNDSVDRQEHKRGTQHPSVPQRHKFLLLLETLFDNQFIQHSKKASKEKKLGGFD